ncbi:hypothetical protein P9B03_07805 [Metasolibacillus meyeri]|uniref:Uncharacterized protein n=1 Tax=Metasolibacillus meyeri TaxID=1071052 RepID=A0AAW9NTV2_9BACL|nr:hypothetical protein [Metasolibacillus meyeri]MEC1178381.1 hypothetical protein [Metasolibacillus meyeri]
MDRELLQLQAPVRTKIAKQTSLQAIQASIRQQQKRQKKQYYSVLVAAILLVSILSASFLNGTSNTTNNMAAQAGTIEKGYIVQHRATELSYMMQWYYFQKKKINEQNLTILEPYIQNIPTSTVKTESLSIWPEKQFLLKMSEGQIQQVAIFPYEEQQLMFVDAHTRQTVVLAIEEAQEVSEIIGHTDSLNFFVKSLLLLVIGVIGMKGTYYFYRSKGEPKRERAKITYFLAGFCVYVLWTFINGISYYYFGAINGLFVATAWTLLFLGKLLIDYYKGKFNYSIFAIVPFFVMILAMIFVYCM